MIVDLRTYTVRPGTMKLQLELYEKHGLEAQKRHLGEPLFYGVTETGPINTYVHIWVYEGATDRERKRAAMQADPGWQAYLKLSAEAGYLIRQENQIMTPVPFAPIRR
ncbi:MAG TPA: NIPSNAP family protein [Geminicoccaceae bacterium]|nr:NIPSNAP family protein [Geminicoccaceae bacterium]